MSAEPTPGTAHGEASMPRWERRFRAPTMTFPSWARHAPDRLVLATNESGAYQIHAWDRARGTRRRVTDHPIGALHGLPSLDGEAVIWFHDETGSEVGRWVVEPFHGDPRERRPLVDGVPEAWSAGLALGDDLIVVGMAGDDGFAVYVARSGGPASVLHRHQEMVQVAGLSRDGDLLCIEHAEHGDALHAALRVLDPLSGEVAGELWDGPGLGLVAAAWSPVPGDRRMALVHERQGRVRPAIWDLGTGRRTDLHVDLAGDVTVAGWWPDGSSVLLQHEHEGRSELHRFDLGAPNAAPVRIPHPGGEITGARVRPDGEIWYRVASGASAATTRRVIAAGGSTDDAGEEVIAPEGDRAPDGAPYRSWSFTNPDGDRIHGFVVTPPGPGPHPMVMEVHGGPTWAYADTFMPLVQAWVDHGFAVALVNYRGSTGYGVAFRDRLIGDPGFPEVEDVLAGLDALIAEGVADPRRAVVTGASWGGYITLLSLGLHPDRWAAGVAAVPVADYVAAFEDEAPLLQAFDKSLFGGLPEELPELYRERSPITYVERVDAPLLILAGENDSRCPIRQIVNYVERLEARGAVLDVYRFDAGHGSLVIEERIRQMAAELAFVLDHVPA